MAKLVHFTNATGITVESRNQDASPYVKPNGFWVSDESARSSWSAYCSAGKYDIGRNAFQVDLAPGARVLTLTTSAAIREFDAEFASPQSRYKVDWSRVADRYQGILITPYQWSLRLSGWYYSWDCASGCIWDAAAIASVT